jgi:hypothetical protein
LHGSSSSKKEHHHNKSPLVDYARARVLRTDLVPSSSSSFSNCIKEFNQKLIKYFICFLFCFFFFLFLAVSFIESDFYLFRNTRRQEEKMRRRRDDYDCEDETRRGFFVSWCRRISSHRFVLRFLLLETRIWFSEFKLFAPLI